MSTTIKNIVQLLIALAMLGVGAGCTLMQPFPVAARAGDTITLGIGSADGMTVANTTVSYVSDADPDNPVNLPMRAVFNLYADKRSAIYDSSVGVGPYINFLVAGSGHEPWETVVVLDLPADLTQGTGTVQVQTTATFPQYYGVLPIMQQVPIALEILPGLGTSNPFSYAFNTNSDPIYSVTGDLTLFQPRAQAVVRPTLPASSLGTIMYGAISLTFNHALVRNQANAVVSAENIRIITEYLGTQTLSQLHCSWSADATQLKVYLLSPSGMKLAESRTTIVPVVMKAHFTGLPTLTAVHYYDLNGNEVSGPTIDQFAIASN